MNMITLYGLSNCDTCRKARRWFEARGLAITVHDLRGDGLDRATVNMWLQAVGWETLLNRRSTTWRQLPASERDPLDQARAVELLLAHPTLVKRPVVISADTVLVGFDEAEYARCFPT